MTASEGKIYENVKGCKKREKLDSYLEREGRGKMK